MNLLHASTLGQGRKALPPMRGCRQPKVMSGLMMLSFLLTISSKARST